MTTSTKLSPRQLAIYHEHGAVMAKYRVNADRLARATGLSRWDVKLVRAYTEEHGPPDPADIPGAIHFIIPDAHAKPNTDQRRFAWLGQEIEEVGREAMALGVPFRVISIGDFGDFPSLSSYDKGKASGENRRYKDDEEAVNDALERLHRAVSPAVDLYADYHWFEGNHEYRAKRFMEDQPTMAGVLNVSELFEGVGWETHDFLEWVAIDGIAYAHFMQTPATTRAISGVNVARSLLLAGHRSAVVGHNHKLDMAQDTDLYGNPIQTLSCGCYFEHREDYAKQSNEGWWRGLCILRNVKNGGFDLDTRTLDSLKRKYA